MAQRIGKPYDIRLEKDLRTRSRGSRAVACQPERYAWIPEFAKNNHADHLDVFGIIIPMYFGDHNPPHFHVEFQGEKATFTFDGRLRSGNISSGTARKLVRDWARRHRLELMINWKNIEKGRPLNRIKPLE
jgi:hypothetical protein